MARILIFLLCLPIFTLAQQNEAYYKKADEAEKFLEEDDYENALTVFQDLYKLDSNNANLNFKIGICYLNSVGEKTKAIPFLEKAVSGASAGHNEQNPKDTTAPMYSIKYLAQAYHLNYQFDNSITNYEKYKTILPAKDEKAFKEIEREIEICNNGKVIIQSPVNIKVSNLGKKINSSFADYAPVITADESTLIFTSRRSGNMGGKVDEEGKFFEDIYITTKSDTGWTLPTGIGQNINTAQHEANIGLSVDGQQLLIYKDDNGDGNIYISNLEGDTWSVPVKLGSDINTKSWEPSACFDSDGNALYFVSDRKGGFGGRDIYRARKLPNGQWGLAENLGPSINTIYDEDAPYIHPDGVTLYFSSMGHKTIGGFDIFKSTYLHEGNWSETENLGYPINTTDDDIFYLPTADGKKAYYSSFKSEGFGEKDIYLIEIPEQREASLAVYKGQILTRSGEVPDGVSIYVTDNNTGDMVGTYLPNVKTGKFLFILPPGGNYNISFEAEGFLLKSVNVEVPEGAAYNIINQAIEMALIEIGEKTVLENIFFDFNQATLKKESFGELEKLLKLLAKNPSLFVEISGHTDSKGNDDFNLKLSQNRAEAVIKWLVSKGIKKSRLKSAGYGETQPIAENLNPDGTENLTGMQKNRRIEFKILSTGK